MGFKTGKTIGELGLTETILEMLDKRIMIISHPSGDGLCDGADVLDNGTMVSLPNLSSEFPGATDPIVVPMANIATGILSGYSIFLIDTDGQEAQIGFMQAMTQYLEALHTSAEPKGLEQALQDVDDDDNNLLWHCEIRLFDMQSGGGTAYDMQKVVVAAEREDEACEKAEKIVSETSLLKPHTLILSYGAVEVDPADYRTD